MLTVNLWDNAFRHNPGSSVHGKTARHVRYVRDRVTWDGITIFTDSILLGGIPAMVQSTTKLGWLLEPRAYRPDTYLAAGRLLTDGVLDAVLTHDDAFLTTYGAQARFVPFGGCWIPQEGWRMHAKTPLVCQLMSEKNFLPGHRLRHEIARRFPQVDCYGSGSARGWITYEERASVLARHRFAVVVENARTPNFFTEKLLDCMAVGTVPIYWGCPNVGDFFDLRGIVTFESIDQLTMVLSTLDYDRHMEGIKANFQRFREYEIVDDLIATNILEGLSGTRTA